MDLILAGSCIAFVIWLYFKFNPLNHSRKFMIRRFINWFPLGMTYAFLYMGRYNLNVAKNALGSLMTKQDFGVIFGVGTLIYGLSFLVNGPLVDKIGGRKGIVISAIGASIANIAMGVVTYLFLHKRWPYGLTVSLTILYSLNMYFQSYGGVSINKVKAYWFHVRERGTFGAVFGTLISIGLYLAFDWGQAIADASRLHQTQPTLLSNVFKVLFATEQGMTDATWLVFFIPAVILVFWTGLDWWLIRDQPSDAGHEDFDTHDASSGEMHKDFTMGQLLHRIFTSPVIIMISLVEFTTGVIRNGVMQWYFIFTNEVKQPGSQFFFDHWGGILCITGVFGGFAAGFLSDKYFHSRRGPPVTIAYALMIVLCGIMSFILFSSPVGVGICVSLICLATIAVHASMSGTAASDFGGRKATATAAGITDGFVYLGSGLQSFCLGYITTKSWSLWPVFLLPFTVLGLFFAMKMWKSLPDATRRYLMTVEKVNMADFPGAEAVRIETETVSIR